MPRRKPGEKPCPRCKAKARTTGERCRRLALKGQLVCRLHGGKSLCGEENPNYKHGRNRKVLPKRLVASFQNYFTSPELLSLGAEVATLKARGDDLLSRLEEDGLEASRTALEYFQRAVAANARKDHAALSSAMQSLGAVLERNASDQALWREYDGVVERMRRLVDTESKRRKRELEVLTGQDLRDMQHDVLQVLAGTFARWKVPQGALTEIIRSFERMGNDAAEEAVN